jgi:hypothetical protein
MTAFETDLAKRHFGRTQAWLQANSVLEFARWAAQANDKAWGKVLSDATKLVGATDDPSRWVSKSTRDAQLPEVRALEVDCNAVDSGHVP